MEIKVGIPKNRIDEVIEYSHQFFNEVMGKASFRYYIENLANVNWNISVLLLNDNDDILGVYILGNHQIKTLVNDKRFKDLLGIEGVLLCVDKSIRGKGWGSKLKDYPKTLGVDYIWGQQFKGLNNLEEWLKRRELIATLSEVYVTAELFV